MMLLNILFSNGRSNSFYLINSLKTVTGNMIININQNKRVSKLTALGVVFMPLNIIAGIGGMSEFSMMTEGISWPLAYGGLTIGMIALGFGTYLAVRLLDQRRTERLVAGYRRKEA